MSDVVEKQPLTEDYLKKMDAYWRAANYLGAAQSVSYTHLTLPTKA